MVRSNTIGRIQESEDLIIANEETVMAIDDYRLYNRMVDLTSKEVETSEAIDILGFNQEQAGE